VGAPGRGTPGFLLAFSKKLALDVQVILFTHDRRAIGQIREAHVVALGALPKFLAGDPKEGRDSAA